LALHPDAQLVELADAEACPGKVSCSRGANGPTPMRRCLHSRTLVSRGQKTSSLLPVTGLERLSRHEPGFVSRQLFLGHTRDRLQLLDQAPGLSLATRLQVRLLQEIHGVNLVAGVSVMR